jgi:DNA-binding XRE family transcriptional regulator
MMFPELANREPVPSLPALKERARLRKTFGITQQKLADAIGVSRQTINEWEGGHKEPSGTNRVNYAAALAELAEAEKTSRGKGK